MHQLKNERAVFRLNSRQILARFDDHLRNAYFVRILQRISQKHVSFVSAFLWLEIVWLVKENRVNLLLIDEVLDVHGLSGFEVNSLKIFVLKHDIFPLFILVALDNLIPGNLLAVFFSDAFVINRAQIGLAQKAEVEFLPPRSWIECDWYVDQSKADAALPNRSCH